MTDKKEDYKYPAYTIAITKSSDAAPLTLQIRQSDQQTRPMGNPEPRFTERRLGEQLDALRRSLSDWARRYDSFLKDKEKDQLKCDPDRIKEVWIGLATWGRVIYRMLFNVRGGVWQDPQMALWGQRIKERKGSRLVIDSIVGNIPWGLLYDEEVPSPDKLGDSYLNELLPNFWMASYELEVVPRYPTSSASWNSTLNNSDITRLTVAINEDLSGGYGANQIKFFKRLSRRPRSISISSRKDKLIQSITTRDEPQHLLYFFCHHEKGGTWTVENYREVSDSKILIRGNYAEEKADGVITLSELDGREDIEPFAPPSPPVVFLNACTSSQVEIGDPESFMYYFTDVTQWRGRVLDLTACKISCSTSTPTI